MENVKEGRAALVFVIFSLAFVLFCLWLVFSSTPLGHRAEAAINHSIPAWLVAFNLLLLPFLGALLAAASRIPISLRFGFGVLMFCSFVIFEATFERFLLGSCGVLAIVLIEAYWIVPKWNAHHRRANEPR